MGLRFREQASILLCFFLISMTWACARTVYPVATGSHVPLTDEEWQQGLQGKRYRFVIWGNHPSVVSAVTRIIQQGGHAVVERARLQEIFNEQKIRLTHTPDDEADLLRVGRLLGADLVIFTEATITSAVHSGAYIGPYGGAAHSQTIYHVSVNARAVKIETGEIRWNGTAHYGSAINNPEQGIVSLTEAVVLRAICPTERGYVWVEPGDWGEWGCLKR